MTGAHNTLIQHGIGRYATFLQESDRIENINLPLADYQNALMFVDTSETLEVAPDNMITDYVEDHAKALAYILQNVERVPNVHDVLEIHRRLMRNSRLGSMIGNFRRTAVMVGGELCPNPASIPFMMDHWCWMLSQNTDPLDAHQKFELIHPFLDGNGRTGRLLWLWLRLHRAQQIGPFLEMSGYAGETFEARRNSYYEDLKTKRMTQTA